MWDTVTAKYLNHRWLYSTRSRAHRFHYHAVVDFSATGSPRGTRGSSHHRLCIEEPRPTHGGGWGRDIRPLCQRPRFNGVASHAPRIGFPVCRQDTTPVGLTYITTVTSGSPCASRTVIEEFGSDATDPAITTDAGPAHPWRSFTTDKEVAILRPYTDYPQRHLDFRHLWMANSLQADLQPPTTTR